MATHTVHTNPTLHRMTTAHLSVREATTTLIHTAVTYLWQCSLRLLESTASLLLQSQPKRRRPPNRRWSLLPPSRQ